MDDLGRIRWGGVRSLDQVKTKLSRPSLGWISLPNKGV